MDDNVSSRRLITLTPGGIHEDRGRRGGPSSTDPSWNRNLTVLREPFARDSKFIPRSRDGAAIVKSLPSQSFPFRVPPDFAEI